jgi:hypothetical protein
VLEVKGEALYRLGLRSRRERKFGEAAAIWREVVALTETRSARRNATLAALRQFAVEALAIHHEHRDRDLETARELALFALNERRGEGRDDRRAEGYRKRIARLERKLLESDARKLLESNARKLLESDARKLVESADRKSPEKQNAQLLWS